MKGESVRHLERLGDQEWDAAVDSSGRAFRFSHRAAAGRAFEDAYPSYVFEPYRVEYRDGTTLLLPLVRVTRRLASLSMMLGMPLGLEGTPITLAGTPTIAHIHGLFRALAGAGMLAIYGGGAGSPPSRPSIGCSAVTHVLDLGGGFERLWTDALTSRNRNSCRKAERAGVRVSRESSSHSVAAYWELYELASRARGYMHAPYPRRLFAALLRSEHAELWLARLDDRVIAGAVLLRGSEDLFYWSGAMDRRFQGVAPSNAVIRGALQSACTRNLTYFDFGSSGGLPGVEKFKESFGPEERKYHSVELSSRSYRLDSRWRHRTALGAAVR